MEDKKTPMVSRYLLEAEMTRMERIITSLKVTLTTAVIGLVVTNVVWFQVVCR